MTGRETIYAALFGRIQSVFTDFWVTRDFISTAECTRWPAAIVLTSDQLASDADTDTAPIPWRLGANVRLYLQRPDPGQFFEPMIHAAIDQIEAALASRSDESSFGQTPHTTLGNLVEWARVRGVVEIFRLPDDQRAVVQVPIEMLAY